MNNLSFLQKSILATIAYYDIFDYPLTGFEIFKYLINPLHIIAQLDQMHEIKLEPMANISFLEVLKLVDGPELKKTIEGKNGFYFLKGRGAIIEERIERQKISSQRWKKVKKVMKFVQLVPFVRMVAACNSLAIDNSKKEADIDFFIIARKRRIWSVRLMVTFLIWLIGQWRHKDKISGRVCLSFYISDEFLDLHSLAIMPYDIYLANWTYQLRPIFCREKTYDDFIAKNRWVSDYLLNFGRISNLYHPEFRQNRIAAYSRKISEAIFGGWLGNIIEKILGFFQRKKISRKSVKHAIPTAVVASDKVLKFHENDKRQFFQEEFVNKLKKVLGIDNNNNKC